jgi:hypothetical protein
MSRGLESKIYWKQEEETQMILIENRKVKLSKVSSFVWTHPWSWKCQRSQMVSMYKLDRYYHVGFAYMNVQATLLDLFTFQSKIIYSEGPLYSY